MGKPREDKKRQQELIRLREQLARDFHAGREVAAQLEGATLEDQGWVNSLNIEEAQIWHPPQHLETAKRLTGEVVVYLKDRVIVTVTDGENVAVLLDGYGINMADAVAGSLSELASNLIDIITKENNMKTDDITDQNIKDMAADFAKKCVPEGIEMNVEVPCCKVGKGYFWLVDKSGKTSDIYLHDKTCVAVGEGGNDFTLEINDGWWYVTPGEETTLDGEKLTCMDNRLVKVGSIISTCNGEWIMTDEPDTCNVKVPWYKKVTNFIGNKVRYVVDKGMNLVRGAARIFLNDEKAEDMSAQMSLLHTIMTPVRWCLDWLFIGGVIGGAVLLYAAALLAGGVFGLLYLAVWPFLKLSITIGNYMAERKIAKAKENNNKEEKNA
jgi:hypothetical protein